MLRTKVLKFLEADNGSNPSSGTPQAGDPANAPQPQAGSPTTTPDPQAGDGQSENISLDEARKLRSEAANLRKRLKAFDDAQAAAEAAKLSENERLSKQYADLQSTHETYTRMMQERVVRYEVERQAAKLGIIDPEAAAKLLDWSELDYEDDGTPKNAEKLLKELLKNKPYLAPKVDAPAPATPAQTAQPTNAPAVPAMNPGRASITPPNAQTANKPTRWNEVTWKS